MARFVVLEHDYPERHWDFMLEAEGVLRTWRLAAPPEPGTPLAAEASFDHRLQYLDYEGPVSGNRGQVMAWDRGTYEEVAGGSADRVVVRLCGNRLDGKATLQRDASGTWLFQLHEPDPR
jgi:DNA polymerase Ligase (LigD)